MKELALANPSDAIDAAAPTPANGEYRELEPGTEPARLTPRRLRVRPSFRVGGS
jgi:hypothetical protein